MTPMEPSLRRVLLHAAEDTQLRWLQKGRGPPSPSPLGSLPLGWWLRSAWPQLSPCLETPRVRKSTAAQTGKRTLAREAFWFCFEPNEQVVFPTETFPKTFPNGSCQWAPCQFGHREENASFRFQDVKNKRTRDSFCILKKSNLPGFWLSNCE